MQPEVFKKFVTARENTASRFKGISKGRADSRSSYNHPIRDTKFYKFLNSLTNTDKRRLGSPVSVTEITDNKSTIVKNGLTLDQMNLNEQLKHFPKITKFI